MIHDDSIIIDGRQKPKAKVFELIVTLIGWFYFVLFLACILLSLGLWVIKKQSTEVLFSSKSITSMLQLFLITAVVIVFSFTIISLWRRYNLKRFGSLRRRKQPEAVDTKAIASYFQLPEEKVEEYQKSRLIVFDKTIV